MRFLDTILDIVFPVNCVSCGHAGSLFCPECLVGSPTNERENFPWIFSIFNYRHPPIRKALWLLKYKGKKRLAQTFAENMHPYILEDISELALMENFREPFLIPIPLSHARQRERGYNQAELLCDALALLDGSENFEVIKNVLLKIKDTKRQAHIENRGERLKNIVGAFAVKESEREKIKDRNIILIDDISTTGATLHEARKILKEAGARKVIAFTIAH